MNENEAKHLQELIRAKKDRLHQLELKEARYGLDVPPHIPIEIEELRGEIQALRTQLEALEQEQKAASRPKEARRQKEEARPGSTRRPVNLERVGAIAGVIAVIIALSAWLVPNVTDFLPPWLPKTPIAIPTRPPTTITAVTKPPTYTPTATPTSSPTHTPFIPTAIPSFTPAPPTPTLEPVAGATMIWEKDDSVMVYVPTGDFTIGSEEGHINERPAYTVNLKGFYIDKYEVTNAQYRVCVNERACNAPSITTAYDNANYAQHPVVHVIWNDADSYCRWAGKRLPTEAQWEKAARGGLQIPNPQNPGELMDNPNPRRRYPWGDEFDKNRCNTEESGMGGTTPVGKYSPQGDSPYGVADMAGNVWEWTSSLYRPYPYSVEDGREDPEAYGNRVLRGGSLLGDLSYARCAYRHYTSPEIRNHDVGFRCARD